MQYSNAALGITVRLLSQFITYFGSFNLSKGKKKNPSQPTIRFLTFCPEYSVKTKLVGSKAKAPDQGQPADGGGGFVRPREGGHGAFLKTLSLCQILHPPGRGSPPYIWRPLSGDGRTAPRTCGAVRTHGHAETLTPFFPTARTPDWVKPRCKQKSRLLPPKLMATGLSGPRSERGCRQQAGALLGRWAPGAGMAAAHGVSRFSGLRAAPGEGGNRREGCEENVLPPQLSSARSFPAKQGKARRPPCLSPCTSRGAQADFCHERFVSPN